tara:strand:+ start:1167 stop:3773 length:2607 start_codon:yes stop_codon:yes gene_type:complete
MAGYLGTLFMANVGMRLLLPPKSEYNKAASGFGSMVQKVTNLSARFGKAAGDNNVKSLRNALGKSAGLAESYAKKNSKKNLSALQKNLSKIRSMTQAQVSSLSKGGQKVMGIAQKMGPMNKNFGSQYGGHLSNIGTNLKEMELRAKHAKWQFMRFAETIGGPLDTAMSQFRSSLGISVTMLTSLGFAISGLVSEFSRFEKELINANSIWQESSETLFTISDRVIKFGENYGVAYSEASRVLYQFASAGLDAAESQAVLNDVLLLSMAVQGDANTIGKLTIQTIKGFGLEMSDAGEVTDKFAHSINASLIEYQDLASAIKFALPFYAATNQDLNQLLGSIQILTDRALEAGIAGRGLRQALAEFAEGAEDATRKFAQMGVEVVNQEGEFLQMTQIARNFANVIGKGVANDTKLLTSLIEDLNIRGATAFIHLVQNVDEFEEAVSELANSQGAANQMASVQQGSLVMQIQLLKNATKEVFYLSDATYVAQGYLNEFDYRTKQLVKSFTALFITEMPDGSKQLTELSYNLRDVTTTTLAEFERLISTLGVKLASMTSNGMDLTNMAKMLVLPLQAINQTMALADNILGTVGIDGGSGLIGKYYYLTLVFGKMGASIMLAANAMQFLVNTIAQGSQQIKDVLGVLLTIASVFPAIRGAKMAGMGGKAGMKAAGYGKGSNMMGRYNEGLKGIGGKYGGKAKNKKVITDHLGNAPTSLKSFQSTEMANVLADPNVYYGRALSATARAETGYIKNIANKRGQAAFDLQKSRLIKTRATRSHTQAYRDFDNQFGQTESRWQLGQAAFLGLGAAQAFGTNISGYSGNGLGYAADPMMAQIGSSSNLGGGSQELYIANANIGSSNFQDLFYNSDQMSG